MSEKNDFEAEVKEYFNELDRSAMLLKNPKTHEYAVVYTDCEQDYPLYVFFLKNEKDLEPSYGDDMLVRDVDLDGFKVIATK